MLWGCFAAGGTGALHKIDGIMRKDNYMDILKQHLKTSVRKLKHCHVRQVSEPVFKLNPVLTLCLFDGSSQGIAGFLAGSPAP